VFENFSKGVGKQDLTMAPSDREWHSTLRIANLMHFLSKILPPNNNKAIFLYSCTLMGDLKEYSTATAAALSKHTQRTYFCILRTEASDWAYTAPALEWEEHCAGPLTSGERTELAGILARCVSDLVSFDLSEAECTTGFQLCLNRFSDPQFLDALFLVFPSVRKTHAFVGQAVTKAAGEGSSAMDHRARQRLLQISYAALLAVVEHRIPKKYNTVEDCKAVYKPLLEQFEVGRKNGESSSVGASIDKDGSMEWLSVYRIANLMHCLGQLIGFGNNKPIFFYACTALGGIKSYKYRLYGGWMNKHSQRVCFVIWKVEGGVDKVPADDSLIYDKPFVIQPVGRVMTKTASIPTPTPTPTPAATPTPAPRSPMVEYSESLQASEPVKQAPKEEDALSLLAILATRDFSGSAGVGDSSQSSSAYPQAAWGVPGAVRHMLYDVTAPRAEKAGDRKRVARSTDTTTLASRKGQTASVSGKRLKLSENEKKLAMIREKAVLVFRNDESILRALKGFATSTVREMTDDEIEEVYRDWRSQEAARRKELRGLKRRQISRVGGEAQPFGQENESDFHYPMLGKKRPKKKPTATATATPVDNYNATLLSNMSQVVSAQASGIDSD